jgi:hypothetical protein
MGAWGRRHAYFYLFLVLWLGSSKPMEASPFKIGACAKKIILAASITASSLIAGPALYHPIDSYISDEPHIGQGIHLDFDEVLTRFSHDERALLESADTPAKAKVALLTEKLSGDYGAWGFSPFSRMTASTFFDPSQTDRGVCRHKSVVLQAVLRQIGIKSYVQSGPVQGACPLRWHAWVYLPELHLVADPTEGTVHPADEYWETYPTRFDRLFIPPGWY